MIKIIRRLWLKTLKTFGSYSASCSCHDIEIPDWCIGDSINSFKYEISEEQQKKVRDWYLKNLPEQCETITNFKSNWIGRIFGIAYYSGSFKRWNGFRLCVGNNVYVRLC